MKKLDFTGTVPLVRLALRRDRIRIPAWVIGISLLFTLIVAAYAEFSIQEMQEMIAAEAGTIIPAYISNVDAHSSKMKGMRPNPLGGQMGYAFAEYVWLEG